MVLVIEELTELINAQRAAAWQEVARRMAHEIKNPLTPIQLSAERIAKRFTAKIKSSESANGKPSTGELSSQLSPPDSRLIKDGTETILREVNSLKLMVDEFSRFARLPNAKLELGNVNEIIRQTIDLYEDRLEFITLEVDLPADLPPTMLDREKLKRVFVNLFENALESFEDSAGEKRIAISTRLDKARDLIVAEIADTGKGIAFSDLTQVFQPYFSTKGRGTGLGFGNRAAHYYRTSRQNSRRSESTERREIYHRISCRNLTFQFDDHRIFRSVSGQSCFRGTFDYCARRIETRTVPRTKHLFGCRVIFNRTVFVRTFRRKSDKIRFGRTNHDYFAGVCGKRIRTADFGKRTFGF